MRGVFDGIRGSFKAPFKGKFLLLLGIVFLTSSVFSFLGVLNFFKDAVSYKCEEASLSFYQSYSALRVSTPGGDRLLECKPLEGENYKVVLCQVQREEGWTSYLLFDLSSLTVYPAVGRQGLTQDDCTLAGLHYSPDLNLCVYAQEAKKCVRR